MVPNHATYHLFFFCFEALQSSMEINGCKGPVLGLTQFLATGTFDSTLKALLILTHLNFCPDLFGHVGKRLD